MREKRGGLWLLVLAASCATFALVFGAVAWLIFHDRPESTTSDLIGVVGVAAGLGAAVGALFGQPLFGQWLAEQRAPAGSAVPADARVREDADRLAEAVKDQWTHAAAERRLLAPSPIPVRWVRSSSPVAGPVSGAVGSEQIRARFPPLPGHAATTEIALRAGTLQDLHSVYGGLASGRLLIVGQPGSGKTGAAVLLVLAALAHREQVRAEDRPLVPVPVMLTLQGWEPSRERFETWLVARLVETYPLFAGKRGAAKAGALLSAGKLAVILDGLDEISETLRPTALRALSDQARFRVVILTRTAEMMAAASEAHFVDAAALELQDIDARVAAEYLTRVHIDPAPPGWRELIDRLLDAPDSAIAKALASPLTLTLLRDTYRAGEDVRELFDVANHAPNDEAVQQDVENRLLDRVLPTAYGPRLGEPTARYDLATAERALRYLARRMNQDDTRDLRWWLVARWAPLAPRAIVSALIAGLVFGLALGLTLGLAIGLVSGIAIGLLSGVTLARGGGPLEQVGAVRLRHMLRREEIVSQVVFGTVFGLLFGLVLGLVLGSLVVGLVVGLVSGIVMGLMSGILAGLSESIAETTSPLSPLASWRADRRFGLVYGVGLGVGCGLATGLVGGAVVGLVGGLTVAFVIGCMYSDTWPARLSFLQLAGKRLTPARLIRFLEDARGRGVLRTVGPVYQFRHARLQDRLGDDHGRTQMVRDDRRAGDSRRGHVADGSPSSPQRPAARADRA